MVKPKAKTTSPPLAKQLMEAAMHGKLDVVDALLARGCDPNVLYEDCSVLAWAVYKGHVAIAKALLARGADPNLGKSYPAAGGAMHAAAARGSVEILDLLLAAGGDPNVEGQGPANLPLFKAAEKGHAAVVARLLDAGADPLVVVGGRTAMLEAVRSGSVEALELLHARGAPLGASDRPLLHQALSSNKPAAVTWLLAHGSDPNVRHGEYTPLHIAAEHEEGGAALIDLLVARGAKVDQRMFDDKDEATGMTPLQAAIRRGHVDHVAQLLRHGADPKLPTGEPEWPDARTLALRMSESHPAEDWGDNYIRILALLDGKAPAGSIARARSRPSQ